MRRLLTLTALALAALVPCAPPSRALEAQRDEGACPEIVASGPADVGLRDYNITFRVKHAAPSPSARLTYNWTISAGSIVGGQGTAAIITDLAGARDQPLEVTVEVGGLSGSCAKTVSYMLAPSIRCGRPLDSYGNIRFNDEKARLDNYAIKLQNDPTAEGHIFCYGGRKGQAGEAERRCLRAKKYLVEVRGVEASRILIVDGGLREELTVEPWVVPAGAPPPQAVPTVDPADAEITEEPPRRARAKR